MKTVEDFFEKYRIEEFYKAQAEWSNNAVQPFVRREHKKLSFGVIPGYRNYDLFYERYNSAVEILKKEGELKNGMKILDVGSGEGFFKFFFDAGYDGHINWDGVEIWKERADFCRHIGYKIDEIDLEKGKFPYQDETYDIVLASHVIEHIPNPDQIIKELARVLRPEGILLIATPTKLPIITNIDRWYHQIRNSKLGETQQAFTHHDIEELTLKSLGLSKESVIDKRGFRIISGRKKLPIEDWKWFYEFSKYLGKKLLYFVPEINLIIKKEGRSQ